MTIRARFLGLTLAWLLGTEAMATTSSSTPVPIRCSAVGAKLFAPAMSPDAVCSRFIGAIGGAAAPTGSAALHEGLMVELKFLPQGVAMASVTRVRAGQPQLQQRFELAVSDRGFRPVDIDRLATDVAAAMFKAPRR